MIHRKNSCAITVTCASFNAHYSVVCDHFKKIRKLDKGFTDKEMLSVWKKMNLKYTIIKVPKNTLLSEFKKKNPKGAFVISYDDHFSLVINKKLYDIDKPKSYFKTEYISIVYKVEHA